MQISTTASMMLLRGRGDLDEVNAKVPKRHAKAIAGLKAEQKKLAAAVQAFEKKAKPVLDGSATILKTRHPMSMGMIGQSPTTATRTTTRCSTAPVSSSSRSIATKSTKVSRPRVWRSTTD